MTYEGQNIPSNHPVKKHFRTVADRALTQANIPDKDLLFYLSDLLTHFMYVDNLYKLKGENGECLAYLTDMIEVATEAPGQEKRNATNRSGTTRCLSWECFPRA